jgi:hypothetical protein
VAPRAWSLQRLATRAGVQMNPEGYRYYGG